MFERYERTPSILVTRAATCLEQGLPTSAGMWYRQAQRAAVTSEQKIEVETKWTEAVESFMLPN